MWVLNTLTAIPSDGINKEPASVLIDKRLDKVIDWEIMEKGSSINNTIEDSSILVKNKYNRNEPKIKPKYPLYTNQFINTIIIPNKYTSIILPIIIETVINIFILRIIIEYPAVRTR